MLYLLPSFEGEGHDVQVRSKNFSLLISLIAFVISLLFISGFQNIAGYQFRETHAWVSSFGMKYMNFETESC